MSKASGLALGLIQPPSQWVTRGVFCGLEGVKRWESESDHLPLEQKWRMSEALPPAPLLPFWSAEGEFLELCDDTLVKWNKLVASSLQFNKNDIMIKFNYNDKTYD
jgi:hypothetical protein